MDVRLVNADIIRKLAHSGIKTLDSVADELKDFEPNTEEGFNNKNVRKTYYRSLRHLIQAISDLRLLAICETASPYSPGSVDWLDLVKDALSGKYSKIISLVTPDAPKYLSGYGNEELISQAIINMATFVKSFWKIPVSVTMKEENQNGKPYIFLHWNLGDSVNLNQDFSKFEPYYPIFPKESYALDKSAGLMLFSAKKVFELHGGTLKSEIKDGKVFMASSWRRSHKMHGEELKAV